MEIEKERQEAQERLADSKDGGRNKIMPRYQYDERLKRDMECDIPDSKLFLEIGFNKTPEDQIKHYRRYFQKELENVEEVMQDSPFLTEKIFRIKQSKSLFAADSNADNVSVVAGEFKGLV